MRKLIWLSTILVLLFFATTASAQVVAGPIPVGNQSKVRGVVCKVHEHSGGTRTIRIRRSDGLIVAETTQAIAAGDQVDLTASYASLRVGTVARAVCEVFPAEGPFGFGDGPDVAVTLSALNNFKEAIESVEGISGSTGPPNVP